MIKLENITKSYARGKIRAVDNINMEVRHGEIFGFIGPNGAGKTTAIKMITGILMPDEGKITIDGIDLQRKPLEAKRKIGYVPDNHDMFDRLTGEEYLNFVGDVYEVPPAERRKLMDKYLELFEIADAAGSQIKSYSHGMKQKILLTGALLHRPPLWILDEPMLGLDPRSALVLKEEMRAHAEQGNTVFFSTHVLEVAERLCHRIGIISSGKLAAVGTLDELREKGHENSTLEQLFFQLTESAPRGE